MNITNNPLYTCVTNKDNPYLDNLTFKKAKSKGDRMIHLGIYSTLAGNYSLAEPYVFFMSSIYKDILQEAETDPQKYHRTKREIENSVNFIKDALKIVDTKLRTDYQTTGFLKIDIWKYGLFMFNESYCEDVLNGVINKVYFVDGLIKVARSFKRLIYGNFDITNNSIFTRMTSKYNKYLDIVTFSEAKSDFDRMIQNGVFGKLLFYFTSADPYLFTATQFYKNVLQDMENYPQRYYMTKQELENAVKFVRKVISDILKDYLKTQTYNIDLCKGELAFFNIGFCEDALNLIVDKFYFVDGVMKVANSLQQLIK